MTITSVEIPQYSPPDLWMPDQYTVSQLKKLSMEDLALELSNLAKLYELGYDKNIYRAEAALNEEVMAGSCLVVAEMIMGAGAALKHGTYLLWDGIHGRTLFDDRVDIWCLGDKEKGLWGETDSSSCPFVQQTAHQESGRDIIENAQGRAVISTQTAKNNALDWQELPEELCDLELTSDKYELMLPAHEAVKFISAMGDKERYAITKPGLLRLIAPQIDRYLPKIINPVD